MSDNITNTNNMNNEKQSLVEKQPKIVERALYVERLHAEAAQQVKGRDFNFEVMELSEDDNGEMILICSLPPKCKEIHIGDFETYMETHQSEHLVYFEDVESFCHEYYGQIDLDGYAYLCAVWLEAATSYDENYQEVKELRELEITPTIPPMESLPEPKEPDFRTEKGEWLVWNMLEYGNTIDKACQLLRQKEIVGGF